MARQAMGTKAQDPVPADIEGGADLSQLTALAHEYWRREMELATALRLSAAEQERKERGVEGACGADCDG